MYGPVHRPRKPDDPFASDLSGVVTEVFVQTTTVVADVTLTVYGATTSTLPYSNTATTNSGSSLAGASVSSPQVAA